MVPAGCGLIMASAGVLATGVVGIWVVSGMVAGLVVCGNTGSVEMSLGESDADSLIGSTGED